MEDISKLKIKFIGYPFGLKLKEAKKSFVKTVEADYEGSINSL